MTRQLIVNGAKVFRITIPDDARVTFGPFSPPSGDKEAGYGRNVAKAVGTLRVYGPGTEGKASVLAVFTDVQSFRDTAAIEYEEQTLIEQGAVIWNSDRDGFKREEKVSRKSVWDDPAVAALGTGESNDGEQDF